MPELEVCAGRFVLVGSCETGSPDPVSGRKAAGFASAPYFCVITSSLSFTFTSPT